MFLYNCIGYIDPFHINKLYQVNYFRVNSKSFDFVHL